MVVYSKYSKVYNHFYRSSQKTFIGRSVQFEEDPMQEIELAQGDCSHPPLHDDVSDYYSYDFFYSDIDDDYYDINFYHESPIQTKQAEKTIQAIGDLDGDPLDSRKTRSQFHNDFSTCEFNIPDRCYMIVVSDPQTYYKASLEPI